MIDNEFYDRERGSGCSVPCLILIALLVYGIIKLFT